MQAIIGRKARPDVTGLRMYISAPATAIAAGTGPPPSGRLAGGVRPPDPDAIRLVVEVEPHGAQIPQDRMTGGLPVPHQDPADVHPTGIQASRGQFCRTAPEALLAGDQPGDERVLAQPGHRRGGAREMKPTARGWPSAVASTCASGSN